MSRSLLTAAVLAASAASATDFKAAFVDVQRAVQEVDEGRIAKARLQALAQEKQKPIEKEQAALKTEIDAFQKQSSTMAEDVRRKKDEELQRRAYEFGQKADKIRTELAEQERKELGTIFPKLEGLLGQLALREGLTMVFDKSSSGLAWAPPSLDMTNELIRSYNSTYKVAAAAKDAAKPDAAKKVDVPKK